MKCLQFDFHHSNLTHFRNTSGFNDNVNLSTTDDNIFNAGFFIFVFLIVVFMNDFSEYTISTEPTKKQPVRPNYCSWIVQNLLTLTAFIIFASVLPIFLIFWIVFAIFRLVIQTYLNIFKRNEYVGMLDSTDVIWTIDDNISRSIITCLALVRMHKDDPPGKLSSLLKARIDENLSRPPHLYPKLFYHKNQCCGYFYWTYNPNPNVDDYVKILPKKIGLTRETIHDVVGYYSNEPLEGKNLWEILVGNTYLDYDNNDLEFVEYPIIFRFHHALGDGVSLRSLLFNSIADKQIQSVLKWKNHGKMNRKTECDLFRFFKILYMAPRTIAKQLLTRDKNILHQNQLSGSKIAYSWTDTSRKLIDLIKTIKTDARVSFGEVLLAAVTSSFDRYCQSLNDHPTEITCVIPARTNPKINRYRLENKFSIALCTIPLERAANVTDQLEEVRRQCQMLSDSVDFSVNYAIMKLLPAAFPKSILKRALKSEQSTFVMSNMQGPSAFTICDGVHVDDLMFWIPNKDRTAIGISIFSYNNRLQIGVLADKVVMSSNERARILISYIIENIANMYNDLQQQTF